MKQLLAHIWRGWKKFAHVLGVVNTKILLSLTYFLILSIISIIARVFGADLLEKRTKSKNSYWHRRDPADTTIESARRQF